MNLKDMLSKNKKIRKLVKNYKVKLEYKKDYKNYINHYMENNITSDQKEYNVLLLVHSLEKGMCYANMRSFGEDKIKKLICLLKELKLMGKEKSFAYKTGLGIIYEWKDKYLANNWNMPRTINEVKEFIDSLSKKEIIKCGSMNYTNKVWDKYFNFDYLDALSTRRSVRNFDNKNIDNNDIEYAINAAILTPTACNRQMIKIYFVNDINKKKLLSKSIMGLGGFNKNNVNLFVVTYDMSAFSFYGERNQGYFNAGLVAMNFVNALHFKGIGSCFLQWGNLSNDEKNIKKDLGIAESEKIAVIIGAGYYKNENIIPISNRKSINDIYKSL